MSKFDPYEHLNLLKHPDGSVTRLIEIPTLPATGESAEIAATEPVISKDVTINPSKNLWIRLYRPSKLPSNDNAVARLPIVVLFHGGGWVLFSAADAMMHIYINQFVAEIPSIVISVNYRLAPESRLPGPYDDGVEAISWVKNQVLDPKGDNWVRDYADLSRCYLYGVSNGANIAFNVGLRLIEMDLGPLRIAGLVMNQPMFGGVQRTKSELKNAVDIALPLPVLDLMWELALPKGTDKDHRYSNPLTNGPHLMQMKSLGRCLVIGYRGDPMVDRQQAFVKMLVSCGAGVEACFDTGFHGIDMIDPQRAAALTNIVKEFIH